MRAARNAYRHYVVWLLLGVYTLNFVGRQILSILDERLKAELGLSDTQLRILGGIALATFMASALPEPHAMADGLQVAAHHHAHQRVRGWFYLLGGAACDRKQYDAETVTAHPILRKYWQQLLSGSQIPAALGEPAFDAVCRAYQEPQRHYHTLQHLEHMLGLVYASGNAQQPAALWATWYHDVVYQPGRSDNEERSAEQARATLQQLRVDSSVIAHTGQIILATRSHTFAGVDAVLQGVLDADMAILGAAPARYREYCEQVRREFSAVPGLLFRRGRRQFLEQVLAQPRIFATDWFWQRFETPARANLASELAALK